jgi:hypothetical protein
MDDQLSSFFFVCKPHAFESVYDQLGSFFVCKPHVFDVQLSSFKGLCFLEGTAQDAQSEAGQVHPRADNSDSSDPGGEQDYYNSDGSDS